MTDYLTHEKSLEELKELADSWRKLFGVHAEVCPDILWCVEALFARLFPHFALIVREDRELPNGPAKATYDPPQIEIRESYYQVLKWRKHPTSRYVLAHEFAHIVLHPQVLPKFLLDEGQVRHRIRRMSVEQQAHEFALFFLVPEHIARKLGNVTGITNNCVLSYAYALEACRLHGVNCRRLLPYEVADLLITEDEEI